MKLSEGIGLGCLIFSVFLLLGMITRAIPVDFISWFAFVFYCFIGLFAFAWSVRTKK